MKSKNYKKEILFSLNAHQIGKYSDLKETSNCKSLIKSVDLNENNSDTSGGYKTKVSKYPSNNTFFTIVIKP
jgi:hypothetical protein